MIPHFKLDWYVMFVMGKKVPHDHFPHFRFDTKNCTAHEGIMSINGTCFLRDQVNATEWDKLNQTASEMKLPADEFFQ